MKKLSVVLNGHQTSISLEEIFIETLKNIAKKENTSIASIINKIDSARTGNSNLSSEIRIWIMNYLLHNKN